MGWEKPTTVWWNRIKNIWLPVLGSLILFFLVFVFIMRLLGPKIGTSCTLAGCLGSFGIIIEGLSDGTSYDLDIQYLRGHEQNLTCEIGKSESQASPFVNGCMSNGVLFTLDMDERPPEELTVTVTVHGKKTSKVFHPTYEEDRPNGENCSPVCYSSIIVMDVSE